MKRLVIALFVSALTSSCRTKPPEPIVQRSFYSSYGPKIAKNDFEAQGKTGEVVEVTKSGIEVRRNFVDGILHGTSSWSFPNSTIVYQFEEYENGELMGKGINYETGILQLEEQYAPQDIKVVRAWYEEGSPRMSEDYRGDKLVRAQYYTNNGDLESAVEKGTGSKITRAKDGVIVSRDQIVGGLSVVREEFYPSGMLYQVYSLRDGLKNGLCKVYLESGQPSRLEMWSQGLLDGNQTLFENGLEIAQVPYTRGVREGIERRFMPGTDQVVQEISWHQDKRHGPTTTSVDAVQVVECFWRDQKVTPEQYQGLVEKQQDARIALLK